MLQSDIIEYELFRMEVYKCLAECYYIPSEDLIHYLERLRNALGSLESQSFLCVCQMLSEFQSQTDIDGLRVDFCRLFIGPYGLSAPPYGSVYIENDRTVMGQSTIRTLGKYREAGLDLSGNLKEPPDHIATELEFMHFLVFKEIEAIKAGDQRDVDDFLHKQMKFLEEDLGVWLGDFSEILEKNAALEFYRNLGRVTGKFVEEEIKLLR